MSSGRKRVRQGASDVEGRPRPLSEIVQTSEHHLSQESTPQADAKIDVSCDDLHTDRAEELGVDSTNFGLFVWNDVSILVFERLRRLVQDGVLRALQSSSALGCSEAVNTLEEDLHIVWEVSKRHLPVTERHALQPHMRHYTAALLRDIRDGLFAAGRGSSERRTEATDSTVLPAEGDGGGMLEDRSALGRAAQKLLEEHGFPEEEFGPIAHFIADERQRTELNCYSYFVRPSPSLPLLVRSESTSGTINNSSNGGVCKRSAGGEGDEEEAGRPVQTSQWPIAHRDGHVELPHPHPHPELNTSIQLMEPRKRKATLDEYRIFSHPKKTATHGIEDFIVDEELLHRSYVVLASHLDAYGSLKDLSPYARFLLWNVLQRDDDAFNTLFEQPSGSSDAARSQLQKLREKLARQRGAFDEVRQASRDAAQQIGWYAVSAQWRDQALSKLVDLEEGDWYLVSDIVRLGGIALFPNYALVPTVHSLTLGVIRKMDRVFADEEEVPCVADIASSLLLPLLSGCAPELTEFCFSSPRVSQTSTHYLRMRRRLAHLLGVRASTAVPLSIEKPLVDAETRRTQRRRRLAQPAASAHAEAPQAVNVFVCQSLVYPLQCFAEMLELCSLALNSALGIEVFTRSFLAVSWEDEESVLAYLLRREPMNPAVAPMVGIPRLYKELVTGLQVLARDKMLPYCVEARRMAAKSDRVDLSSRSHAYWKALSVIFEEEARADDLVRLSVSTAQQPPTMVAASRRWYSEATMERVPKVWAEDLVELMEEENKFRQGGGGRPAECSRTQQQPTAGSIVSRLGRGPSV